MNIKRPQSLVRSRGLTIAETLVSLTLLSLLMLAVLNLFPSSMTVVAGTRTARLARAAAQNKVEALAAQPFAALSVGLNESSDQELPDGTTARLTTTVSAVAGYDVKFLKRIRCQVAWRRRAIESTATQEVYVHALRR